MQQGDSRKSNILSFITKLVLDPQACRAGVKSWLKVAWTHLVSVEGSSMEEKR